MKIDHKQENLIPLSSFQHYIFCPRQCALIHIGQVWAENIFTAEGRLMHERAHDRGGEMRDGVRIDRSLAILSLRLGIPMFYSLITM